MVLTADIKRKLLDKITAVPCSIQELAFDLNKNWRTVDRYVSKLEEEGLVSVKEFKKGDRVAFKIAYLQPELNVHLSSVQKRILKKIESGNRSQDFSPLNIVQYLNEDEFTAYFNSTKLPTDNITEELSGFFRQATQNVLIFSGDLSWTKLKTKNGAILDVIESLAKEKVSIRIIARVDKNTKEAVEKLMMINQGVGNDAIEIHHEEHPLRCFVIDGKVARLKEPAFSSQGNQLKKIGTYFYQVRNESWVNWLERLFWSMFRSSVPADKRMKVLDKIEELKS